MDHLYLKHIERAESRAGRRRNILALFHPEDEKVFFDISKDVLAQSDCALYYLGGEDAVPSEGEICELLDGMCAVLLVVSARFLFQPCEAKESLLPLVLKSRLPILPILTEQGLEEAFNTKIGSFQCLCPYAESIDATTVPYSEKLGNYLSRLLATDIDETELRGAFDASVFLSYRKKDRAMAQKLMRLIHEDPACRGVSVWYDEFLTPGEDFNQSLETEIVGSDLFVLAVTPFMLEGNNYVKVTEYPLACSLGKTVLPIMMESTDRERLSSDFPGIAEAMPATDAPAVREAILAALHALGLTPIEGTAQKQFLKGVAYLKGICVEKDAAIAAAMIESAAEAGLPAAMARIALMYKEGDGVTRDLAIAAGWQEKLLAHLLSEFESNPSAEASELYTEALAEMADIHAKDGDFDGCYRYFAEINDFCRERAVGKEDDLLEKRAGAFELAGKTLMNAGRYWDAWQSCFKHALELRKTLLEQQGTDEAALAVIEAHGFIATCAEEGDAVVAVKEQIVFIKNALAELDGDELFRKSEAVFHRYVAACNLLSHLYNYMLPLNAAQTWDLWDMAMDRVMKNKVLINRLMHAYPSRAAERMLLRTLINEGDIHADKKVPNHQQAAFDAYREARLLFDEIYGEDFSELEAYVTLADLDIKAARIFRYMENYDTAEKIYESALGYLGEMLQASGIPRLKRTLYESYLDAAECKLELEDPDGARAWLGEAEALVACKEEYLLDSDHFNPSPLIPHPDRARALELLGKIAQEEWDIDTAIEFFTEKHEVVCAYARVMKRIIDQKAVVATYRQLISLNKMAGDFAKVRTLEAELAHYISVFHLNC